MKTKRLYRPVGLREMELIAQSDYREFPPRLDWQPIFYPVLNQGYAEEIAEQWNVPDPFSGYCGLVTSFSLNADYINHFQIQNVGDNRHDELWIPAEELNTFNKNIIGKIEIVKSFLGNNFTNSENTELNKKILSAK